MIPNPLPIAIGARVQDWKTDGTDGARTHLTKYGRWTGPKTKAEWGLSWSHRWRTRCWRVIGRYESWVDSAPEGCRWTWPAGAEIRDVPEASGTHPTGRMVSYGDSRGMAVHTYIYTIMYHPESYHAYKSSIQKQNIQTLPHSNPKNSQNPRTKTCRNHQISSCYQKAAFTQWRSQDEKKYLHVHVDSGMDSVSAFLQAGQLPAAFRRRTAMPWGWRGRHFTNRSVTAWQSIRHTTFYS